MRTGPEKTGAEMKTALLRKFLRPKRKTKAERDAARMAEEIIAIADDASADVIERENAKGEMQIVPNREAITRAKLRIDVRMWLMSRLAPHVYGAGSAKPAPEPLPLLVDLNYDEIDRGPEPLTPDAASQHLPAPSGLADS